MFLFFQTDEDVELEQHDGAKAEVAFQLPRGRLGASQAASLVGVSLCRGSGYSTHSKSQA